MNIYNITSELNYLSELGVTINVEERLKLESILFKLPEINNFD
jgi:hypothetical protein